jgi:predicted aminopeptidase
LRPLPHVLKFLVAAFAATLLSGCQIGYLVKSAYSQADLLRRRVPLEEALKDAKLSDENKRKLLLAQEARDFAEKSLGLQPTKNYTSFVQLDRPYVTYVVSAAFKRDLTAWKWKYPIVGSLPYKGYFNPEDAKAEAAELRAKDLDVYVRGVSAYSTLGWFRDPILSSMLSYRDHQLVNTIIHETVHATIYIKSEADFNERLATFIGNKGAEAFYRAKEGEKSETLAKMAAENRDDKVFSEFIGKELDQLHKWYEERKGAPIAEDIRVARIAELKTRFRAEVRPRLSSEDSYKNFETAELNNARLLTYRLYYENLEDFETVFSQLGHDFHRMLEFCKSLEKSEDPKADLAKAAGAQH